jgi:hypothetical protein
MSFDADAFMNTTVDSAGSTELPKTPEGEFRVVIGQMTSENFKTLQVDDKNNVGQKRSAPVLSVPFIIRDQDINKKTDRETIVHYETFWLDFDASGKLDMSEGKNVKLNQMRDCLGQNVPGWSPMHLSNSGPLMIAVKHSAGKTGTPNEGKTFVNINKFAKIS